MSSLIPEKQIKRKQMPKFLQKLQRILEVKQKVIQTKQYNEYICWFGDNQILIKNRQKLEQEVLPKFFKKQGKLSSFIRQLNYYQFRRQKKLSQEKGQIYFRNEQFRRGQLTQMLKIKKNNKKRRCEERSHEARSEIGESQLSIDRKLDDNALLSFKDYVEGSAKEIIENLKKIEINYPKTKLKLSPIFQLCNRLIQNHQLALIDQPSQAEISRSLQYKNMPPTMGLLPRSTSSIFSPRNFNHTQS